MALPTSVIQGAKGKYGAAYYAGVANVLGNYSQQRQSLNAQQGQVAIQSIGAITQTVMAGFDSYRQYSLEREKVQYDRDRALVSDRQWQLGYERQLRQDEISNAHVALENEKSSLELVKLRRATELEAPTMAAKMGFAAVAQDIQSDFSRLRTDGMINPTAISETRAKIDSLRSSLKAQSYQNPGINLSEEHAELAKLESYVSEASKVSLGGTPVPYASLEATFKMAKNGTMGAKLFADASTSTELPGQYSRLGTVMGSAIMEDDAQKAAEMIGGIEGISAETKKSLVAWSTDAHMSANKLDLARTAWTLNTDPDIKTLVMGGMKYEDAVAQMRGPTAKTKASGVAPSVGPAKEFYSAVKGGPAETGGYQTDELKEDAAEVARIAAAQAKDMGSRWYGQSMSPAMFKRRVEEGVALDNFDPDVQLGLGGAYQAVANQPIVSIGTLGIGPAAAAIGAPLSRLFHASDQGASDNVLRQSFITTMHLSGKDSSYGSLAKSLPALEARFAEQDSFYQSRFASSPELALPAGRGIDTLGSPYSEYLRKLYFNQGVTDETTKASIAALFSRIYGADIEAPVNPIKKKIILDQTVVAATPPVVTSSTPPVKTAALPGMR